MMELASSIAAFKVPPALHRQVSCPVLGRAGAVPIELPGSVLEGRSNEW